MRIRSVITTSLAAVLGGTMLLGATAAWGHEEINPSTIPLGKPVFFTLNAANEKTVGLTKITLKAPRRLAFGATTKEPVGWTVQRSDTMIIWFGVAVAPEHFEQWGFEIDNADQPGTYTYAVKIGRA